MGHKGKPLGEHLRELGIQNPMVAKAEKQLDETIDRILHKEDYVMPENLQVLRCEEYSTRRKGVCDEVLDEHGNCPKARDHGEHLADS